jgi:isoleucyl-tRNA synthetase
MLTRLSEAYRKLRNTFRFALGNLDGFDPVEDSIPAAEMHEIDQWILVRAEKLTEECLARYEEMSFHRVYQALYNFATTELSSIYFDVLKDRLYTSAKKSRARRSAQTALHRLMYALVRLLTPILTFTTEELWGYMKLPAGAPDSVHLSEFPKPAELTQGLTAHNRERAANWDKLIPVREQVLKSLEVARQEKFIGAPLEARVHLKSGEALYPLLEEYAADLPGLFIVSQVSVENGAGETTLAVHVERAEGTKCERCWKYTNDVGFNPEVPTVCASCAAALEEMGQA